uniref:Sulfotransferase n=1 Tax=Pogona vitticeps TaxID=103695 RepID=A0ABM5FXH9_9SAUR
MAAKELSESQEKKQEELEKTTSKDGLFLYDGSLYPAIVCCPETLKILDMFKARRDDVVLVGYAKTGTHWVAQMLTELEAASGKYDEEEMKQRQQKLEELKIDPFLEFGDPEKFERMEKLPSRRIIKTHLIPHKIPRSIFEQKPKMLVLFRNPKDTAVSYYHFSKGMKLIPSEQTWDDFFSDYINGKVCYGAYLDHIIEWNKYIDYENVMFTTYEELKENTTLGLKKIAEFFEFSVTEQDIQTTIEKTSLKAMKDKGNEINRVAAKSLFRKGIVGDWTSLFTEEQSKEMDRRFEEHAAGTKLGKMLKYDIYCKN